MYPVDRAITGGGADCPRRTRKRRRRRRIHSRAVEGGRYLAVYNTYTAVVRVGIVLQCRYTYDTMILIYIIYRCKVLCTSWKKRFDIAVVYLTLDYIIYIVDRLSWVLIEKLRITIDNSTNDCVQSAGSWLDQLNCDKICVYYCTFVYNIGGDPHLTGGVYSPVGLIFVL